MTQKKSSRKIRAEKLYLDLLKLGVVNETEKEAVVLLTASCMRAKQDTKKGTNQKRAYVGKDYGFESELDMATYYVTELTHEWDRWKEQTKIWEQIKEKNAKDLARPSIDKIIDELGYIRGNLQTLSHEENNAKAKRKQMKATAFVLLKNGNLSLKTFESISTTAIALNYSETKVRSMAKSGYAVFDETTRVGTGEVAFTMPIKFLEEINSEEERKAHCEVHGITYNTPSERAERDMRMTAKESYIEYKNIFAEK